MSLAGNGNVMRLVADVYLSAGKKKKSSKGCQAEKYFISWSAKKRFGQSCNISSHCQSELVKDLPKKTYHLAFAGSHHGEEKVPSCPETRVSNVHSANKHFLSTSPAVALRRSWSGSWGSARCALWVGWEPTVLGSLMTGVFGRREVAQK